jgi:solute carrier family 25 carnitine/acylcarnitine transporter 20/29
MISKEAFIAGFAYGGTTVLVGQPLDTLKTLKQVPAATSSAAAAVAGGSSSSSFFQTITNLYSTAGIRGFYRGGMPLLLGGGLMRSAQFGVYNSVVPTLENQFGRIDPKNYWLGCINPHVVAAGWAGGIGRGLVEGPFETVKVRRQIVSGWSFDNLLQGFGATIVRNSGLFAGFVIYMDIFKQQVEENRGMKVTPFIKAGICANLAWLTIWPLDLIKTRRQSGKYDGRSLAWLLRDAIQKGDMYRGLSLGMLRSFIANGASMEVYTIVERELRKDKGFSKIH